MTPKNVDEYMSALPTEVRSVMEHLRRVIRSTAPEAEEVISYSMPAYKYHGMLLYIRANKNHGSLHPANSTTVEKFKAELKGRKLRPGTIQFSYQDPLPDDLVKRIVQYRMKENLHKHSKKA